MNQLPLFTYGTLQVPAVLSGVINKIVDETEYTPAVLNGFRRFAVRDARYPTIRPDDASQVAGHLIASPSDEDLQKLDEWEGDKYDRITVTVQTPNGPVEAWAFADMHGKADVLEKDWSMSDFRSLVSQAYLNY